MTKLSERLREEYNDWKSGDVLIEAANLLDECERALTALVNCPVVSEMDRDAEWGCLESIEAEYNAQNTLIKLRAAQEKADEAE